MNRGSELHRRWVDRIANAWRRYPCTVFVEHHLACGNAQTFLDVFVDLQNYRIGVEVELSVRRTLANAMQALQVGCNEVHLLFPAARLRDLARRRLMSALDRGKLNRIAFLLLNAYVPQAYREKHSFLAGQNCLGKSEKTENESE